MKRHRGGRDHLSDIFYTTGDMDIVHGGSSFGVPAEDPHDKMIRQERLNKEHHREEKEQRGGLEYPSCDINDRPSF